MPVHRSMYLRSVSDTSKPVLLMGLPPHTNLPRGTQARNSRGWVESRVEGSCQRLMVGEYWCSTPSALQADLPLVTGKFAAAAPHVGNCREEWET